MIKKLRKRFILIAMLSTAIVLILIIGSINISNYLNVNKAVSSRIELINENNGELPLPPAIHDDSMSNPSDEFSKYDKRHDGFRGAEAFFDTRFFTVSLSTDGTVISINTGRIFATTSSQASEYATSLFNSNKEKGFVDNYGYKCITKIDESGNESLLYVFVDCERELTTFRSFALASAGISLAGLLLVFILVYFFSGIITKPMVESYEKQKRFITDASHELKTPLTIIDANTEIIEMTSGESEWTTSTRKQVARLTSLTEKLVLLARMDEENTKLEMRDFSLSDAVSDTAKPFESIAKASLKTFNSNIAEDIIFHGDEKSIRQLVSLLMDNAFKYSNENGFVDISLQKSGKNAIITVTNSVEKIQPGKHDEFFERFYRADASHNSKTGGFGIGLSVVFAIVNAHKGKITAKSPDDKSIQFTVIL